MQQRNLARRAAPTMLFVVLAVWVSALFLIVGSGRHPVSQQTTPASVQQARR